MPEGRGDPGGAIDGGGMRVLVIANHMVAEQNQMWPVLVDRGVDVHLLASSGAPSREGFPPEFAIPDGVVPHLYEPTSMRPRADHLWWRVPHLRALVKAIRPDVIHVVSEPWGLLVGQALAAGPPVVAHGADNLMAFGGVWESRIRAVVARRNLGRLAGYVSWNQAGLQLAYAHGLPPLAAAAVTPAYAPDLRVLSRSVEVRDSTRRHLGIGAGRFAVGFVGRLTEQKGLRWLVEASRLLRERLGDRLVLVVVGDGPLAPTLRALELPWLRLTGALPWRRAAEVLAAVDLAVVPSVTVPHWAEQFGRVVVEAFLCGVPVISSDCGALPEVVADAGIVVPQGDVSGLARAMCRVADSSALRESLVSVGASRATACYSPGAVAARLLSVWEDAC